MGGVQGAQGASRGLVGRLCPWGAGNKDTRHSGNCTLSVGEKSTAVTMPHPEHETQGLEGGVGG